MPPQSKAHHLTEINLVDFIVSKTVAEPAELLSSRNIPPFSLMLKLISGLQRCSDPKEIIVKKKTGSDS